MHPSALSALASRLRAIGFDDSILARLGSIGPTGWIDAATKALDQWSPEPALKWAVRALVLGEAVPTAELTRALTEPGLKALRDAELLDPAAPASTTRVHAMIVPMAGALIASDRPPSGGGMDLPDDFVLPIGNASALLSDLTVRTPAEIAVDIGVGQGFLSVLMARHARRVIATDINPRALRLARISAELSGASDSIEWRGGNLLDPLNDLRGRVNLLACNPPFILAAPGAPRSIANQLVTPDGLIEQLVRGTPAVLAEGGWATVLGLWHHPEPGDWSARPRAWLGGAGCDALILRGTTHSPSEYYRSWIVDSAATILTEDQWRQVCAEHHIGAVTFGVIVLRKRAGENWLRAQTTPLRQTAGPASGVITRLFDAQTRLMDPAFAASLLDRPLKGADNLHMLIERGSDTGEAQLVHRCTLLLPMAVNKSIPVLLGSLTGRRPAREDLAEMAARGDLNGMSPTDPRLLKLLQQLVLAGFVELR